MSAASTSAINDANSRGNSNANVTASNSATKSAHASGATASSTLSGGDSDKNQKSTTASSLLFNLVWIGAAGYGLAFFLNQAYRIRLQAIEEYGPVIHEFDPYFNYRATEYLYENGAKKFFTWFDYKVWYPLGRPVGTTIYPGMQFTAVFIKNHLVGDRMTLNDVCCYMPAWFGTFASFLIGCIAYECTLPQNCGQTVFGVLFDALRGQYVEGGVTAGRGNNTRTISKSRGIFGLCSPAVECGVFAAGIMAVVPAHLMRSVGGGYDNESVAISALSLTFLLWIRSLRVGDDKSWMYGVLAGVAYFYMVAAWGGYVFVLNLIGVHAATLVLIGRFSTKVYLSYSLFYVVGTALAVRVPVVGWAPLKSLEQLGPCAVFMGYQVLYGCEVIRKRRKLSRFQAWKLRIRIFVVVAALAVLVVATVAPSGYFGPISSRVRGLFVKHTKTGNPLVDSVAEHQPASLQAYFQYLHHLCTLAPLGFALVLFHFGDGPSFLLVYGMAAYFFSHKMVRLILLTGPIASALGGIAVGRILSWSISQLWDDDGEDPPSDADVDAASGDGGGTAEEETTKKKGGKKSVSKATQLSSASSDGGNGGTKGDGVSKKKKSKKSSDSSSAFSDDSFAGLSSIRDGVLQAYRSREGVVLKRSLAVVFIGTMYIVGGRFKDYCWRLSKGLSNPTIILKGQLRSGETVYVDDYREAYWWIRDHTPEDARIMAWWDYGYQITAISNRTTIADGNTWNHEHIGLLGKILTGSVEESYEIARHMADYILIWGGGGGDDLAKSPHLARIANSVYRDHCPGDPTCRAFGMLDRYGTPSPMMKESLLYSLHGHQIKTGVEADPTKFKEVYRSKYGKVRVYQILGVSKESKDWVADPANRRCDVPGSWFCPGQYPPALKAVLDKRRDFAQLEDFNKKGKADEEYQKQYFEHLNNPDKAKRTAMQKERDRQQQTTEKAKTPPVQAEVKKPPQDEIDKVYNRWADTEETTMMWKIVSSNSIEELEYILRQNPLMAFVRSEDGRGPMWWAFEHLNQEIVKILMKHGVPHTDKDKLGKTPVDLLDKN